eukprot:COSAG02_NODE_5216_length_4536_cov_1.905567_3_plen_482_part_00
MHTRRPARQQPLRYDRGQPPLGGRRTWWRRQGSSRTPLGMDEDQRAARLARLRGGRRNGPRPSLAAHDYTSTRAGASPAPLEPRCRPSLEGNRRSSITTNSEASFSARDTASITDTSERRMSDTTSLADTWKLPARSETVTEEPTRLAAAESMPGDKTSAVNLAAMLSHRFSPETVPAQPAPEPTVKPALRVAQQPAQQTAQRELQLTPATPAPVPVASTIRPSNAGDSRRGSVQELLAPPPSPLVTTSSMVTELAKLHKLSREGSITDDEMAIARQQLLHNRSTAAASPRPQPRGVFAAAPRTASSQPVGVLSSGALGTNFGKVSATDTLLSKLRRDAEQKANPTQQLLQKLDNDMRSAYTARAPSQSAYAALATPALSSSGSALNLSLVSAETPRPTANTWHGKAHIKQATSSAPAVAHNVAIGFGFGQPSPRGEDDDATKLLRQLEGDIMAIGATRSSHRVRCMPSITATTASFRLAR